jgi:hypothetical protein
MGTNEIMELRARKNIGGFGIPCDNRGGCGLNPVLVAGTFNPPCVRDLWHRGKAVSGWSFRRHDLTNLYLKLVGRCSQRRGPGAPQARI